MSNLEETKKDYTMKSLLTYAAPTILAMIFVSVYTMVDGIFLARFVDSTALAAVNIFMPIYALIFAIALMLGTGGSAIIAKKMGENNPREAQRDFTNIVVFGALLGLIIMILGLVFIRPILEVLGAGTSSLLFDYTFTYGQIILWTSPFLIIQGMFEALFVTAGKPKLSLLITIIGGSTNIALDYLFIVVMNMGVKGAALATSIGIVIPSILGIIYFLTSSKSLLYFTKFKFKWGLILESSINGSSEMVTNLSSSVVTFAFNFLMLKFIGVEGVAAVTIMLYAMFILTPLFMGYSVGIAPIISYNYGRQNVDKLKKIFKNSLVFITISSISIFVLSHLLGPYLIRFMAVQGSDVYEIAKNGFWFFSLSFLFMGINIFTSMLFTALSNGKISAIISILRTLVFVLTALLVLPPLIGINGIWIATPLAELLSVVVCTFFLFRNRKVYQYF
ncbi:MATE family efflux transporter [Marinilactibacillus sp. GCM10026970]|uniref:MATE family efflux transporter n=1 Tax=Marinilactibacillus sp. GCM10026970 TaxID=3252642 RepID=UPI0036129220